MNPHDVQELLRHLDRISNSLFILAQAEQKRQLEKTFQVTEFKKPAAPEVPEFVKNRSARYTGYFDDDTECEHAWESEFGVPTRTCLRCGVEETKKVWGEGRRGEGI